MSEKPPVSNLGKYPVFEENHKTSTVMSSELQVLPCEAEHHLIQIDSINDYFHLLISLFFLLVLTELLYFF